jgi:hypothetical protein
MFRHTFKEPNGGVEVCIDGVCLAHNLVISAPVPRDQQPRTYLVVAYTDVRKACGGNLTPEEFVKPEIWSLRLKDKIDPLLQGTSKDKPAYNIYFGVTDVYRAKNQLFAILQPNEQALGADDSAFVLSLRFQDQDLAQDVSAKGIEQIPLIDPISAQHKTDQEILVPPGGTKQVREVDQFKASIYHYLGRDFSLSGNQVLSTNRLDTAAKLELDLHKVLPGQDVYKGTSYQPVSLVVGGTANQIFTQQVVRVGIDVRAYYRHMLKGYIPNDDLEDFYIPPYPIEKVQDIPWFGISLFGSYIARRDDRVVDAGPSRFYSYLKPQFSFVVSKLKDSDKFIRSGFGIDAMLKAWIFLNGRENAGNNLHTIEDYAHLFATVKFGKQQAYFGYEWGTNEANGFRPARGWTVGIDLKF